MSSVDGDTKLLPFPLHVESLIEHSTLEFLVRDRYAYVLIWFTSYEQKSMKQVTTCKNKLYEKVGDINGIWKTSEARANKRENEMVLH